MTFDYLTRDDSERRWAKPVNRKQIRPELTHG